MKLLVFSDSHGRTEKMKKASAMHADADLFVFLGDGIQNAVDVFSDYPNKRNVIVTGNCDAFSAVSGSYPNEMTLELAKIKTLFCHGHTYSVKSSLYRIAEHAEQNGISLVLYGHTHSPREDKFDGGITVFNPGSIAAGSFGLIYIENGAVLTSHGII